MTKVCSACGRPLKTGGRPLKTGVMANGKMVTKPSCRAPLCKKFGKPS